MSTYREQLEVLSDIRLKSGEHSRIDCPFCGGKKTLSLSSVDGSLLWNCYKASCDAKGRKSIGRNADQIKNHLTRPQDFYRKRQVRSRQIPSFLSDPSHHGKVVDYLKANGSYEAYEHGLIKIRYAPADDRVLFYLNDESGAVGKSLRGDKPKWLLYGEIDSLFTVGTGNTVVVVEDAASACGISRVPDLVGCALLGTNMSINQKDQLRKYDRVIIALDKDASQKSIQMQKRLTGLTKAELRFLNDDPKHLTAQQISRIMLT